MYAQDTTVNVINIVTANRPWKIVMVKPSGITALRPMHPHSNPSPQHRITPSPHYSISHSAVGPLEPHDLGTLDIGIGQK
jgi:hypothetical protein